MLKRFFWLAVTTVFFAIQSFISGSALAFNLTEEKRTVKLNEVGDTITLTNKEYANGRKLFGDICASCHAEGRTKTNPNVTLTISDLQNAFPARDNIESLVDYIKHPTTYDGSEYDNDGYLVSDTHPAVDSADLFPKMRNKTEQDLVDMAGLILIEAKRGIVWGGGKTVN